MEVKDRYTKVSSRPLCPSVPLVRPCRIGAATAQLYYLGKIFKLFSHSSPDFPQVVQGQYQISSASSEVLSPILVKAAGSRQRISGSVEAATFPPPDGGGGVEGVLVSRLPHVFTFSHQSTNLQPFLSSDHARAGIAREAGLGRPIAEARRGVSIRTVPVPVRVRVKQKDKVS